ncbi:MAG: glycine cleavage T C-terminal barrel domain-containing protein [Steroidobacteraceae bacterium]
MANDLEPTCGSGTDFTGTANAGNDTITSNTGMRTLVWNADDVIDVYASLYRKGTPYHIMEMPRDQRGFMYADKVLRNGKEVGVATSRGYSYYFREMLSLCTIDVEHAEIGKGVTVVWGNPGEPQKDVRATVARAPYKQDNRRIDLRKI